jgi:hypothetical protein
LEEVFFEFTESTIILKNLGGFYFTPLIIQFMPKGILYSTLVYFFEYATNQHRIHKLELDFNKAELSLLEIAARTPLFNTLNAFYTDLVDDKPKSKRYSCVCVNYCGM